MALRTELKEKERVFFNKQIKRDQDLLKILEDGEKEMEMNLLKKVDAFE